MNEVVALKIAEAKCKVRFLMLSANSQQDLNLEPIAQFCNRYATAFQQMQTQYAFCGSGQQIGPNTMVALAPFLKQLTVIDLHNNQLSDHGAAAIAQVITSNKLLTKLDVSGNSIGPAGCEVISEALAQNETITSLNLSAVAGVSMLLYVTLIAERLKVVTSLVRVVHNFSQMHYERMKFSLIFH